MGHIEDTQPISVLAERVWAGPAWHYPHIEQMCKEMRELRAAVKVLAASEAKHAETNRDIHGVQSDSILDYCDEDVFNNPIAAAAVREAGR